MAAEMKETMNNSDEIDLREIFLVIWKRKFWIAGFVFVVCAITVFVVLRMDNIYESKAILRPSQNNTGQMSSMVSNLGGLASLAGINLGSSGNVSPYNTMNAILQDDDFIYSFVIKNKFESKIVDDFDELSVTDKYKENPKFFIVKSFDDSLNFTEDAKSGLFMLSFQNKDRLFAKKVVDTLLIAVSAQYKTVEMKNVQERIDKYKSEMEKISDITLRNKLAEVVAGLIQNKVLSQAQEYYGFDIIVNSGVADELGKVKPKRALICIVVAFLSFFTAVIVALISDSFKIRSKGVK
ncbi:Wzz/FepE/Etk N-terminal domain-containing protein [Seleniivibrio woodruffii]|uniref:Wzz/FepE/Etk N-terminal domain-containing protein n=1 Tax=Seleniivibrio woodruffii TaxID=1078050 RepID=UPI0026EA9034|nr:Wzz/FepE/Etk N-terminal domain-containing protein [Seleniivibrio woodruffii]